MCFLKVHLFIPLASYRVAENAIKYAVLNISRLFFLFALSILFLYRNGLIGAYIAVLLVNIIFFIIYLFIIYKDCRIKLKFSYVREGLQFSLPLIPASVSFLVLDVSDRFILAKYVSLFMLGIYSLGYKCAFVLNLVVNSLYLAIEPVIFRLHSADEFLKKYLRIKSYYLFITVTVGYLIAVFSKDIISFLASEKYMQASHIIPIVVLAAMLKGYYIIYSIILAAEKKHILYCWLLVLVHQLILLLIFF